MSIELETCEHCGETRVFSLDKHTCRTAKQMLEDIERRREIGNSLSMSQRYHLFNWED